MWLTGVVTVVAFFCQASSSLIPLWLWCGFPHVNRVSSHEYMAGYFAYSKSDHVGSRLIMLFQAGFSPAMLSSVLWGIPRCSQPRWDRAGSESTLGSCPSCASLPQLASFGAYAPSNIYGPHPISFSQLIFTTLHFWSLTRSHDLRKGLGHRNTGKSLHQSTGPTFLSLMNKITSMNFTVRYWPSMKFVL